MLPAAVYFLKAAEWQQSSLLNIPKDENQLVRMHVSLLFFFPFILYEYSGTEFNDMSRYWMLQKPPCSFYSSTILITAHQTSRRFFTQVSCPLQNKWLHIPSKTTHKYFFFLMVPVQVGRRKLYLTPHELSWRYWPKAQSIPQQSWRKVGLYGMEPSRWQKLSQGQLVWREGRRKTGQKWEDMVHQPHRAERS